MRAVVLADGPVGATLIDWLIARHADDLALVVTTAENAIHAACSAAGIAVITEAVWAQEIAAGRRAAAFDLGFLIWWPRILSAAALATATGGFFNTHPSLLPFGRGKHPNFWAIVERTPFGVSLHRVTTGIDNGAVVGQTRIPYGWEDTGETLHRAATREIVTLFQTCYGSIRSGTVEAIEQDLSQGRLHLARELEPASLIDLDSAYRARDLFDLLRARTFTGYPSARFVDGDETYEVSISITRKTKP
ncbi:formyl transferase [Siculibacillus lacustris]|uniref:Formyl transferase n=1 Tax=Siculibacillus lacustris TaxID=1549641 RepID=A0A4Q9VRM7_9HYPH|nr:formyltransferase family protein [Siculibacillus lacustris]TBW38274.1 formyl transferase [Siculibacillus lacustris]